MMNEDLHKLQESHHANALEELLDDVVNLLGDDTLSQQTFSDWSYSQRFKAMRSIECLMKENSRQGKRSDLEETQVDTPRGGPSRQSRHKLSGVSRRSTTRDWMADRLGIATATLSKYRRIGKLPDDLMEILARMLDEKTITFEAAYWMSGLKPWEIKTLAGFIDRSPDKSIDLGKLKVLCTRSRGSRGELTPTLSKDDLRGVLVPKNPMPDKLRIRHRN